MNRFLPMLLGVSLVAAPGFVLAQTGAPSPAPVAPVVRTTTDVQPAKPVTAPAATTAAKKETKPAATTTTTAAKPAPDAAKKPNAG